MNPTLVDRIVNAVLYEGYILYPYRPSVKNRQRWTFGGLYPRSYSEAQAGTDPWMCQTECLVYSRGDARLSLRVRFLHLQLRRVVGVELGPGGDLAPGRPDTWQEAVERDVEVGERALAELVGRTDVRDFAFPARRAEEPISAREEGARGTVIREQHAIAGSVELSAGRAAESIYKVTV